ncbi:MAG: YHS domain-containing protein [Candidatus Hydrogenedentes bacterium]|nr:YHS domain-containing protein [Candidatus Hydrogenedentota bacterium]
MLAIVGTSSADDPQQQTVCPVLVGNPIDPDIFTVYQGKKVYFCCPDCKTAFEKEPEKYLANLPQFAVAETDDEHGHEHGAETGFSPSRLVKPAGISTFTLLILTACAGLFMPKHRKLLFKWHRGLATATLIVAVCHVLLVLLFH